MTLSGFLAGFGFEEDPFASTNAADEPRLGDYFVRPPYFAAVLGDARGPKPNVVLAPRGGGKTAQRRMIEEAAVAGDFLCVTYDTFDLPAGFKAADATWEYHAGQICRLITVGIVSFIHEDPSTIQVLDKPRRQLLRFYIENFIGPLSAPEFASAVKGVRTAPQRAASMLAEHGGVVGVTVKALLAKLGLDRDPPAGPQLAGSALSQSLRYHLDKLVEIAQAIDFLSIYVLIDGVDELAFTTSDSDAVLEFIRPLLGDLKTIETLGFGFKFFLWDQVEEKYREWARPDRVGTYKLSWSAPDLEGMMSKRLGAHSNGTVTSLNDLLCEDVSVDLHALMARMAVGSPRDMIRMSQRIVAEQTRSSPEATCVSARAMWEGIREFSRQRAEELFGRFLPDLRKVGATGRITFTISQLASDVFRINDQSARSKVQKWMATGLVSQIGTVPKKGGRPQHLYGAVDLRLAIEMLTTASPDEVLGNYALVCPGCAATVVSDDSVLTCLNCGRQFKLADAKSVLELCMR